MVRVSCGSECEMRTGYGRCLSMSHEARTDATFAAGVLGERAAPGESRNEDP